MTPFIRSSPCVRSRSRSAASGSSIGIDESFEPLGVPRGQIRVRVVHQARDVSLGCDAEEPRNRMMCRWVSAERECAADLLDERRVV
jgi:hypothetical protein